MKIGVIITSLCVILLSCMSTKPDSKFDVDNLIDYCVDKTKQTMNSLTQSDSFPRNIYLNQTKWNLVDKFDWTSGFWPGVLWYAYEVTNDDSVLHHAQRFTQSLTGVLDVPVDNHDLGFMFYCSYGNGYRLTHDSVYRQVLLRAADSLATLFNPRVGTILSWPAMRTKMNWPHNTIIDNMINLELLFWASKNGGDSSLYNIAVRHAEVCMNTLIRPDSTTFHVAVFDTLSGDFIKGVTHQGYSDSSQWARGQAWGIYGYTMCYRETKMENFLVTAQKLADKFISMMPVDTIPFWDFNDPSIPNSPKDASAAAIIASGLLELSSFTVQSSLKEKYKNTAFKLLKALSSERYLCANKNQAMLLHSTGHWPNNSEIDASIIYADYYFLEALLRLKKITTKI